MTALRIVPRPGGVRGAAAWLSPILAAAFALMVGGGALAAFNHDPLAAFRVFFVSPFSSAYQTAEIVNRTVTLAIIALGLSVGFRANVWNIGAEGQFVVGALAAGALAVAVEDRAGALVLPLMFAAGALGGIAWAAIPAFLRVRFNANEILASLMLAYAAQLLLSYCVHGPLRNPEGFGFPQSRLFAESALLPSIWEGTRLSPALFLLPLAAAALWLFFNRSYAGFQARVTGTALAAARTAGYSEKRTVWLCFAVSGGAAGLMGAAEVSGNIGQLTATVSPGFGFAAIIVAFLGRLSPPGVILAALLTALIQIGGESAQISMGLPKSVGGVFQGLILFALLAAEFLERHRLIILRPAARL